MAGKDTFANTATTTLVAAMTDTSGTSITVASSTGFPAAVTGASQFRIRIDNELLIVTNVSGTTWTVTRGAESSTAATHLNGAAVYHIVTAGSMGVLKQIPASVNASPPTSPATDDLWLVTDKGTVLLAPTAGGAVYGDGSNYQVTAAGTQGQVLMSNVAGAPTWAGGVWVAYTPTISGYTTVTLAKSGRYIQIGKTVMGWAAWNLTAVTTLGSSTINVTLPVAVGANMGVGSAHHIGTVQYRTNAGTFVLGEVSETASANTVSLLVHTPSAANPNLARASGAAPAGQVVGDHWYMTFCYEVD